MKNSLRGYVLRESPLFQEKINRTGLSDSDISVIMEMLKNADEEIYEDFSVEIVTEDD